MTTPWMVDHTNGQPKDLFRRAKIFIYGIQGAGKSTTAITISDDFPGDSVPTTPLKERVWLDDIFYLQIESHGTSGFYSLNIVPRAIFDVEKLISDPVAWKAAKFALQPTMSQAVDFGLTQFEEWLKTHPNGKLVVDSLSTYTAGLQCEYNQANSMRMYGDIGNSCRDFWYRLKFMDFAACVFLAQSKALWEDEKETEVTKARREAGKSLDGAKVVPDMPGQSVNIFQREAIFVASLQATRLPGGGGKRRYLHLEKMGLSGGKNRFEHFINSKQDAHLRKLLRKIENNETDKGKDE